MTFFQLLRSSRQVKLPGRAQAGLMGYVWILTCLPLPWLLMALRKKGEKHTQPRLLPCSCQPMPPILGVYSWKWSLNWVADLFLFPDPWTHLLLANIGLSSFGVFLSLNPPLGLFHWLIRCQDSPFSPYLCLLCAIKTCGWVIIQVPSSLVWIVKSMYSSPSFAAYSLGELGNVIWPLCASVSPSVKWLWEELNDLIHIKCLGHIIKWLDM